MRGQGIYYQTMEYLSAQEIQSRQTEMRSKILELWADNPGHFAYYVQCLCGYECYCRGPNDIPRIRLSRCYYASEFNILMIEQPFIQTHGFLIYWMCVGARCDSQFACGDSPNQLANEVLAIINKKINE